MLPEPFEDSRRLTGCNVYFDDTGAALETACGLVFGESALARWRDNIAVARRALGWGEVDIVTRVHRSGASLAFAAPLDQLYAATEANEWAWASALLPPPQGGDEARLRAIDSRAEERQSAMREGRTGRGGDGFASTSQQTHPHPNPPLEGEGFKAWAAPGHPAIWDEDSALHTLQKLAAAEAKPALIALRTAADARELPFLTDDGAVSIGAGTGGHTWPIDALPKPDDIDWPALHAIPTALVTGSNGKTTTVRLVAAMMRAHGWCTAHSCTDGVFLDGEALESGDFSGPGGARTALRQQQAQAAVLETARGGILRRGLALRRADVAVVTNIAADHFGEYGVHDLDDLAAVKLTVARAVGDDGLLVLNADDAVLRKHAASLSCAIGWFADDDDALALATHRDAGGATCGAKDGHLRLQWRGASHDLGAVDAMPLTLGGRAHYNVANVAAAALAAVALGVAPATIATTLARFGTSPDDNPGRLQHWRFGATDVYVDYAHNPDGLHGLMRAIGADARHGRLAILLGHAGNREDDALRAVAAAAAGYHPEFVVLKDIEGYERGRAAGEIAAIMRAALLEAGMSVGAIETRLDEVEAARTPLQWARDGDLVVLPVHEAAARNAVVALLDTLRDRGWRAGQPLPPNSNE